MPEGAQFLNDAGVVQLDADYFTVTMTARGVFNTSVFDPATSLSTAFITVTGTNPLVAFKVGATGGFIVGRVTQPAANQWTYLLYTNAPLYGAIDYYVFDTTHVGGLSAGAGFELFNASGELLYSLASNQPLRIGGIQAPISGPASYAPGRTYALLAPAPAGRYYREFFGENPNTGNPLQYRDTKIGYLAGMDGVNFYTAEVRISQSGLITWNAGAVEIDQYYDGGGIMVVDVTHY